MRQPRERIEKARKLSIYVRCERQATDSFNRLPKRITRQAPSASLRAGPFDYAQGRF